MPIINKVKSSRGSMAVYVTIVVLSMLLILLALFFTSNSVRRNQLITVMKVKETYEADNQNAGAIYRLLAQRVEPNYVYLEDFDTTPTFTTSACTYSVNDGIITLTSSNGDPMVYMNNVTSFSPSEYRYLEVRCRTNSSTMMEFFMIENPTNQTYSIQQNVTGDGQWNIVTFDLWSNENVKNRETITGWRWDWGAASGITMEVDYIKIIKE